MNRRTATITRIVRSACIGLCCAAAVAAEPELGWREDFSAGPEKGKNASPVGWQLEGTKLLVNRTEFRVVPDPDRNPPGNILVVEAKDATGTLVTMPRVDIAKYPILRWKWRVKKLPPGGDGRQASRDDQAIGVYVGAGGVLSRKSISFRWETETPIGTVGSTSYVSGVVSVKYFCLRNKTSPLDTWVTEEVDIEKSFKEAYGFLPGVDEYIVSFCGNSQYTDSHTVAEVAYIEMVSRREPAADGIAVPDKVTATTEGEKP